ncbi:glycoside hydrolase family 3 N-terminal domain-containing protein [Erythrobacter sp. JK5]|uniref:glycoside hydrolase family 3 N-terminal domain-containing protein n=1 Tax=Erythrobacter sp. JK5 TaxID=2829500 RepID=UPI001BA4B2E2|nr:glycoside hydrolase family 3 N-terminal domain-containing protein [Erythrobacter sp. JK5]QUL37980.1 glycoside hydrolase family 3 C-terminal domain-containing protein [Erythrobacter sp. JK5]
MSILKRGLLSAGIALAALSVHHAVPAIAQDTRIEISAEKPMADAPYWDASLPVEARVADLLARMTIEEKLAQMISIWTDKAAIQDDDNFFDPAKASARYPHGLGFFTRPSDLLGPGSPRQNTPRSIEQSIAYVNALQKWAREQSRLGIPILTHEESLHGLAALNATSFPQAIGLASTWNPDLVREVNDHIAGEVRARGVHQVLSPVVDVARDPRWGRIEETFGEDPFLVGEMGVAAVEGLQGVGTDPKLKDGQVLATLKHMTGHGQPESGTNIGPAQISERTLREAFFPPFKEVVDRTAIDAVMASYNEIDGIPSHSSTWLLGDILRDEWGYKGTVVSDYFAIEEMVSRHKIAAEIPEAAVLAMRAGVDIDFPDGASYKFLEGLLAEGKITEAQIDTAVERILTMKFNAGLFEQPFVTDMGPALASNTEAGVALARKAAEQSLILLKNDGVLPLSLPEARGERPTIAVIGPNADVARLGGYYGIPRNTVSPLEGIRRLVGNRADIIHAPGVTITLDDDWWEDKVELADPADNRRMIAQAVDAARDADTIVLFIGDTEQTSREGWAENHLGDRTSLDLVGEQNELFRALKALGKPIVTVLINGRPPSYLTVAEQSDAILEAWYAGEQQGNAIADALFGRINPGGKLPVTVARNAGQLPFFYNHKPSARRGYLFDDAAPLYPFGFGLSYSEFEFFSPSLSSASIRPGEGVTVRVPVTNTSAVAGDEVVQVYLRDIVSSVTRPVKELVGFKRVTLQPGENRIVDIAIRPDAFALWNREMKRVVEPGEFMLMVGPNSRDVEAVNITVAE